MDASGEVDYRLMNFIFFSILYFCQSLFQLLLLTFAAALYRTLKTKEEEGRSSENVFQEERFPGDSQDERFPGVFQEDRLSRRVRERTPPSSPRLKEVRVVRGVRRRLGTSL